MFEEMVSSNKTPQPINKYFVVPPSVSLVNTPTKVLKNLRKTRHRKNLVTIKIAQSDTTASARLLSTALHSVSHANIRAHTYKIALYNKYDTS